MSDMVVIVPSRGRPENIRALMDSFSQTHATCDLHVVVDECDPRRPWYERVGTTVSIVKREGPGMAKPLNTIASRLKDKYRFFAFMGDDHRPRTPQWDQQFCRVLESGKHLVYGNDLLQGERLATAVAMRSEIVAAMDGMAPPRMQHLHLDTFWMRLGRDLSSLSYLPNVIIEHMHPSIGKAKHDQVYADTNGTAVNDADFLEFQRYVASDDYRTLLKTLKANQ